MIEDTIYFFDGKKMQRYMGFGQMTTLAFACYIKAQELGYKKIICEWHDKVAYLWDNLGNCRGIINTPRDWLWDIKFVNKGSRIRNVKSIDLSEPNSLYEGCQPIMHDGFKMIPFLDYLNKYYLDSKIYPKISVEKTPGENYFLFHYRSSEQDRQLHRNTPIKEFKFMLNILRERYSGFKFKKFGEPSPLDSEFDEIIDYKPNNITELFKVINNSSLYIGNIAGPISMAYMFGIPTIMFLDGVSKSLFTEKGEGIKFGNSSHDWVNPKTYFPIIYNEVDIETKKDEIYRFIDGSI
jgi:hypothetical protein